MKRSKFCGGGAIVAVILIHNTPLGISQVLCRPFLNFAVGLFLFLSGFLTEYEKINLCKRIKKVLIPYIIWTGIYAILFNSQSPERIPVQFIKNMIAGNGAAVMYYIWVYCELTILIPLIDKLSNSKWKHVAFAISPIEIILVHTFPSIMGLQLNKYLTLIIGLSCIGWFDYFYLGYLLRNDKLIMNIKRDTLIPLYFTSIVLQIIEGYYYFSIGLTNCGTQMKLSSVFTGLIVAVIAYEFILKSDGFKCNLLKLIGDNSFGIFFSHLAIMHLLQLTPMHHLLDVYPINGCFVLAIALALSIAIHRLFGKYSICFGC